MNKEINYFDILPDNFFNIFSSSNKRIYATCINLLYLYLGEGNSFGANKEDLLLILTDYYESHLESNFFDEDNQQVIVTPREKSLVTLRKLKQYGWIFEEDGPNYEIIINFNEYAISIIKTLNDLSSKNNLEYQGYVSVIYALLREVDKNRISDIIDQVYENTMIVMNKLKALNSNIKKYIQKLFEQKENADINVIINDLLVNYQNNIIDGAYQRLKTFDNVSKYRPFIIKCLNDIKDHEEIIHLTSLQLIDKKTCSEIEEAKNYITDKIDFVISNFENLDNIIDEIDRKNSKYIQTSVSKILFIVNNTVDLQGKVQAIMRQIVRYKTDELFEEELLQNMILISTQKNLDTQSLYTQPIKSQFNQSTKAEARKIKSKEEKELLLNKFNKNNIFSKKSINEYVLKLLGDKEVITLDQIPLNDGHDYTKLILIYLYSNSFNMSYKINKLNRIYENMEYQFVDFEIWKI